MVSRCSGHVERLLTAEEGARILNDAPILDAYRDERIRQKQQRYPSLFVSGQYDEIDEDDMTNDRMIRGDSATERRNIGMSI